MGFIDSFHTLFLRILCVVYVNYKITGMVRKLLVICGPTATGKTTLALKLARKFDGELVSADSRQVYKGMDIGTGKDLPKDSKFRTQNLKTGKQKIGFYEVDGVRIWGYDLVGPKSEFGVGKYIRIAEKIIRDIWIRGKLPILVGGTGLYIKGVVDGIPTAFIPKKRDLRKSLEGKKVDELFEILAQLDPVKAGSLNSSDQKNPRRLIRAIEVAQWQLQYNKKAKKQKGGIDKEASILFIGLTAPFEVLCERIELRVEKRVKQGIEKEIKTLLRKKVGWSTQSTSSLGYKQWRKFFEGEEEKGKVVERWKNDECRYAKKQMSWFRRDKRINWFDISKRNWEEKVERLVKKWYSSG